MPAKAYRTRTRLKISSQPDPSHYLKDALHFLWRAESADNNKIPRKV